MSTIDVSSTIDEYIRKADWRVNANANQDYSLGGMILNTSGKVVANYWLDNVFSPEAGRAHREGDIHIHDLDMLSGYCAGWSLRAPTCSSIPVRWPRSISRAAPRSRRSPSWRRGSTSPSRVVRSCGGRVGRTMRGASARSRVRMAWRSRCASGARSSAG